ncbi:hypothetical protein B0H11DRAFT_1301720 [Mycena galericulata]|nr:hypothetical protein B0H11DRAFT_1301720 [Mycena galericulata]
MAQQTASGSPNLPHSTSITTWEDGCMTENTLVLVRLAGVSQHVIRYLENREPTGSEDDRSENTRSSNSRPPKHLFIVGPMSGSHVSLFPLVSLNGSAQEVYNNMGSGAIYFQPVPPCQARARSITEPLHFTPPSWADRKPRLLLVKAMCMPLEDRKYPRAVVEGTAVGLTDQSYDWLLVFDSVFVQRPRLVDHVPLDDVRAVGGSDNTGNDGFAEPASLGSSSGSTRAYWWIKKDSPPTPPDTSPHALTRGRVSLIESTILQDRLDHYFDSVSIGLNAPLQHRLADDLGGLLTGIPAKFKFCES